MQYLFRGKRIEDGLWIYGSLISWPDGDMEIITTRTEEEADKYLVIPGTVGMWTGFTDIKGNKIFTGDIFGNVIQLRCVVGQRNSGEYRLDFLDKRITPMSICDHKITKSAIQGNIHDNPELVKPAAKEQLTNTMTDPNQPAAGQEQQETAALESASQDKAMEATDSEEGSTEG